MKEIARPAPLLKGGAKRMGAAPGARGLSRARRARFRPVPRGAD